MLNKIIDHLIKTFGREVLEQWIPLNRLSITSITEPELRLTDIPLPDKLFESPSIPFVPVKSNIGSVVLRCPWKAFLNNDGNVSLTVEVCNVDAVLRLKRLDEWNPDHVQGFLLRMRDTLLRKWKSVASSWLLLSGKKRPHGSKAVALANAIDISINNVKLVFVDTLLQKEPFSITIEAEKIHGIGMSPDDPSLNEDERQGIIQSVLSAMWFHSIGVHIRHSTYQQEPCDTQINAASEQYTKPAPPTGKKQCKRKPAQQPEDAAYSSDYSHSSDELFEDVEHGGKSKVQDASDSSNLWDFCTAPCSDLMEHEWVETLVQAVKPEDVSLVRILQGPYQAYSITPPEGIRFDLVVKNWNLAAFPSLENVSKQSRKTIQLSFTAIGKYGNDTLPHAPCFDGKGSFDPFTLILTSDGAELLYNIIRYIQLTSIFRQMSSGRINSIPDVSDCERYIRVKKSSQWNQREEDAKFVEEFERNLPFHILLKIQNMCQSSTQGISTANACFMGTTDCCAQDENEYTSQQFTEDAIQPSYEWYQWESRIRIVFANVNICIVPMSSSQAGGAINSTMLQFSSFAFQGGTLYGRSTYKILVFRPIVRLGVVKVSVKRHTFSAKILFSPDTTSEILLCYTEDMYAHPDEFFSSFGSDDLGTCPSDASPNMGSLMTVTIERYANYTKHLHIIVPKVVILFNGMLQLSTIMDESFWHMRFITLEEFIDRNNREGHHNEIVAKMLTDYIKTAGCRSISKIQMHGVTIKVLIQNGAKGKCPMGLDISGTDQSIHVQQEQNVLDWFLSNNRQLNMWEYCEDIDNPFLVRNMNSRRHDYMGTASSEGMQNTIYHRENFEAELDVKSSKLCDDSGCVLLPGGESLFYMDSRALSYLSVLRRWYRNTFNVRLPEEAILGLDSIFSLTVSSGMLCINKDSAIDLTCFTMEDMKFTALQTDASLKEIASIGFINQIKRMFVTCVDVEGVNILIDTNLSVFTTLARHRHTLITYANYAIGFIDTMKNLTGNAIKIAPRIVELAGDADVCNIIRQDFYEVEPSDSEEYSADLMDALERKILNADHTKKLIFLSAGCIKINLTAENSLYEVMLNRTQIETQGKERVCFHLASAAVCEVKDGSRKVLLSSSTSELGMEYGSRTNVEHGQIVVSYNEGKSKVINVEMRSIHHIADIKLAKCVMEIVKRLKSTSLVSQTSSRKSIVCNFMVHHSSIHYEGISLMVDLYAVVKAKKSHCCESVSIKIPRFHVTFNMSMMTPVLAVSLIDVDFDVVKYYSESCKTAKEAQPGVKVPADTKVINVVFDVSHFVIWGLHRVPEGLQLKNRFNDVRDATDNLRLLLHETWFNHMTVATLPSSYDEKPLILVPLAQTQYSDAARLMPMLNQTRITDWLISASQKVEPDLCDGAAAQVIKEFSKCITETKNCSTVKATASIIISEEAIISMGEVKLSSLEVFMHNESIRNIFALVSQCRTLVHSSIPSTKNEKTVKILKIEADIGAINIICQAGMDTNYSNTMQSSLLPSAIVDTPLHKKRSLLHTSIYHILRMYRFPRVSLETNATCTTTLQTGATLKIVNALCNRVKGSKEVKEHFLFELNDVFNDARYQANLHFLDTRYNEGNGKIVSLNVNKWDTTVYTTNDRFTYWRDLLKHPRKDGHVPATTFFNVFEEVLKLEMLNISLDLCLASRSLYATKLTIQKINLVDAWGKMLITDLYDTRSALGIMDNLDEASLSNNGYQVSASISVVDEVFNIQVALEHTKSELQINGISLIAGVMQDLGLLNSSRTNKAEGTSSKHCMKLSITLSLHELWFFPAVNDSEVFDGPLQSDSSIILAQEERLPNQSSVNNVVPYILKTAKEVEYHPAKATLSNSYQSELSLSSEESVIGCLISLSVSSSKKGHSNINLKYMGIVLGAERTVDGIRALVDEQNDLFFNNLESDERMLLELRESSLKTKQLEKDSKMIAFHSSKPKVSVNVDQLVHLCMLKRNILDTSLSVIKAHRSHMKEDNIPDSEIEELETDVCDLMDEIKSIASKYGISLQDLSNMQGSVYKIPPEVAEKNSSFRKGRERKSLAISKALSIINKIIWKDTDRQLNLSVALSDCKFILFSLKNELVLNFNLHQLSFYHTHAAPTCKRKIVVDSNLLFNITTYNSNLNYQDTVLKTTMVTLQMAYECIPFAAPALDINIRISGLAVEINACLLQLFKQLFHTSSMMSSERMTARSKASRVIRFYNELDVAVSLVTLKVGDTENVELVELSSQSYTQVPQREVCIFMKDEKPHSTSTNVLNIISGKLNSLSGGIALNNTQDIVAREGRSLLFGNSNNVKTLLEMIKERGNPSDSTLNLEAVHKYDASLSLIGKYRMEYTGSRIYNVSQIDGLVLVEQLLSVDNTPYVILSSSIRIQNFTDMPMRIRIDHKLGYLTKVAYKLTQHSNPKPGVKDIYLEPYTSCCVPLSWFGTHMMPTIELVFDEKLNDSSKDAIPFQCLYNLLNLNQRNFADIERIRDFILRFRGFLSLKCSVVAKEVASANDSNSCFYHFLVLIEPMVQLVNILPCDISVSLSLNRAVLSDDATIVIAERHKYLQNYKVKSRLKTGESLGIPFSEQKLYMRVKVFGTQVALCNSESNLNIGGFEYISPVFQIYLPSLGTASIVKILKIVKGSLSSLYNHGTQEQNYEWKAYEDRLNSMWVTLDLSRHNIRVWWPYTFENMSKVSLILNGCLLHPMTRLYGNLYDASNCRLKALVRTHDDCKGGKQVLHCVGRCVKLDLTSTTDFRPPINLVVPLPQRCMSQNSIAGTPVNVDGILESIANMKQIHHARRYAHHETINRENLSTPLDAPEEDKSAVGDAIPNNSKLFCLGSTVRYAAYPYNMCKIVSIANQYTFLNQLPFAICIRGSSEEYKHLEFESCEATSDLVIMPGESGAFHSPFQWAYIIKVENGIFSGIFPLQYSCIPHVFQLELNSGNVTYSTMATRGLLIQVNVISGVFEGSSVPYSHNGYYFVLSFPYKPEYQILNLTPYTLAYTVPENIKLMESQMVDDYESYEHNWIRSPMNKIGILPPSCITHYVPSTTSKLKDVIQVGLRALHVESCPWHIEEVNFVGEGYRVMDFINDGNRHELYITIMVRSNGTRTITVVNLKAAAMEFNRLDNSSMSTVQLLQWSSIKLSCFTPRITITLSTKRKVIMALHLTDAALSMSIKPSNTNCVENNTAENGDGDSRCSTMQLEANIQSIHIDHFVQGCIPVILKSSAKRSSHQESFLNLRVSSSNFMTSGLPIYDLIQVKLSPLSINIEICVIEQLIESIENMLKLPIGDIKKDSSVPASNDIIVLPQPKWVEMEPAPPMYIRRLIVAPISLILAIRTSSQQLAHQTMRILDALPLDTPCVCVHFAREERDYMIIGWRELMHSLRNSYLRQLIRQSLPSAWLSNSLAVLYGTLKGLMFLVIQPLKTAVRFRNPAEGFSIGICNGVMSFILYIAGGATQSVGHVLNIFHKIVGGHRSKPQGVLDAIWLGINIFFLHVFYHPWRRLIADLANSKSRGDGFIKTTMGVAINLTRCAMSPLLGAVNMLITVVEGFSNVLLGDLEQFTHVYESDQLDKETASNISDTNLDARGSSQNSFVRRMRTSVTLLRREA